VKAVGGRWPYSWSLAPGSNPLPAGLVLQGDGFIAGTPTASAGAYILILQVTDADGLLDTREVMMWLSYLKPEISNMSPSSVNVGDPGFILAVNGLNFVTASVIRWNGIDLETTLASPSQLTAPVSPELLATAGTADVSVFNPTEAQGGGSSSNLAFTIANEITIRTEASMPSAVAGEAYSLGLTATGGTTPYRWMVAPGSSLPPGSSLNPSSGFIGGTPAVAGDFTFAIEVVDSVGAKKSKSFTMVVRLNELRITTGSLLPAGAEQSRYLVTIHASGGVAPYSWTVTEGRLPPGLVLDASSGVLAGTAILPGVFHFAVQVSDAAARVSTQEFVLTILPEKPLTILTTTCPDAYVNESYRCSLEASGGVPSYVWSLGTSSLPRGLSFHAQSGTISGKPTGSGPFQLQVQVTDAMQAVTLQPLLLKVFSDLVITINVVGSPAPALQNKVTVDTESVAAETMTGQLSLTFTPNPLLSSKSDDPAIQFSTGGRMANFVLYAGSTTADFGGAGLRLQTGTVAGEITLTLTRLSSGVRDILPSPSPTHTVLVGLEPPTLTNVRITNREMTGFTVEVEGFATPREIARATFQFIPKPGQTLLSGDPTIPLSETAQEWFQDPASFAFGSQFLYTRTFAIEGATSAIASVAVTLSNSVGHSNTVSATF
jgi:hypothetical protein